VGGSVGLKCWTCLCCGALLAIATIFYLHLTMEVKGCLSLTQQFEAVTVSGQLILRYAKSSSTISLLTNDQTVTQRCVRSRTLNPITQTYAMPEVGAIAIQGKKEYIDGLHTFTVITPSTVSASGMMVSVTRAGQSQAEKTAKTTGEKGWKVSEGDKVMVYNAEVVFQE